MRANTLESVRLHARTMHAKEFRISPPMSKIADGEIDRNVYLVASDWAFLTTDNELKLTIN